MCVCVCVCVCVCMCMCMCMCMCVQYQKDPDFKAEWMLIAFWNEVPVYPHSWVYRYPQFYSTGFRDTILNNVCCGTLSHVMSCDVT